MKLPNEFGENAAFVERRAELQRKGIFPRWPDDFEDLIDAARVENLITHIDRMEGEGGVSFDGRHPMGCEQEQFESAWIVVDPVADLVF